MSSDTPPMTDEMPPGPEGVPVLGNYPSLVREPLEFLMRNAREYGDVVGWEEFDGPVFQLNHPEHIEHVLVQNNQNYVKGASFQKTLSPITGNGILNSEGAVWRRNRHLIQPAFAPQRIQEYAEMMTSSTQELLDTWQVGETRPFHEDMMELTLKIVSRALFGVDIDAYVDEITEVTDAFVEGLQSLPRVVLPERIPTPSRRKIKRARDRLDRVVDEIIEERRESPGDADVVSTLLSVTDDEGNSLSTEQVRDEVTTLLLAGHETTANALTFTAHALARHPDAEARLVEELDDVLGGRTPTMGDLPALSYTEQVVKESMRLYPPVPSLVREPVKPDIVGGYKLPKGATVRIPQWVVHRDDRWYDDPLAFEPGRWDGDFEDSLPKLAYFPFGAGPRRCIGDRFAMLEARLILATIYQQYHLELPPGAELDVRATVTARPEDDVPVTIQRR